MAATVIERRESVIAETEFLMECREWPPKIATRLGYGDLDSLRTQLARWGRKDLVAQLSPEVWNPDVAGRRNGRNQHTRRRR
jgi:hypothetical protein